MKITLIQAFLYWEDPVKNLSHLDELISQIKDDTQLIVLPEMFSTGFTMNPAEHAEASNGAAFNWMKKVASEKKCVVCGSVSVKDGAKNFNRLYWVRPDGSYAKYDKRHLFRMGKEDQFYAAGSEKIIEEIDGVRFCPLVCYDLRFPVWSRNKFDKANSKWDYDVLIYVANWPAVRSYPWKQLLISRAIENQSYVLGVNRVGEDGNGMKHTGDSAVISAKGEIVAQLASNEEGCISYLLDIKSLDQFRRQFPLGLDADDFSI